MHSSLSDVLEAGHGYRLGRGTDPGAGQRRCAEARGGGGGGRGGRRGFDGGGGRGFHGGGGHERQRRREPMSEAVEVAATVGQSNVNVNHRDVNVNRNVNVDVDQQLAVMGERA
jgi:hypothetical protein